jgi:hypothetical protein
MNMAKSHQSEPEQHSEEREGSEEYEEESFSDSSLDHTN